MDVRTRDRRAAAGELIDDGDRGDEIAPCPAVGLVDGETADAESSELVEDRAIEGVRLVPGAHLLARHLRGGEAAQGLTQLRDVLGLVGEVHARSVARMTHFAHPIQSRWRKTRHCTLHGCDCETHEAMRGRRAKTRSSRTARRHARWHAPCTRTLHDRCALRGNHDRILRGQPRLRGRLRQALIGLDMGGEYALGGSVTVGLLIYLVYVLLHPERF